MNCSSQYLSRNFPCFRGITLPEVFGVIIFGSISSVVLGLGLGFLIGSVALTTVIIFSIGMFASIYYGPTYLASLKEGKPHGYVKKKIYMKAQSILPVSKTYRSYNGWWTRRKSIGDSNV